MLSLWDRTPPEYWCRYIQRRCIYCCSTSRSTLPADSWLGSPEVRQWWCRFQYLGTEWIRKQSHLVDQWYLEATNIESRTETVVFGGPTVHVTDDNSEINKVKYYWMRRLVSRCLWMEKRPLTLRHTCWEQPCKLMSIDDCDQYWAISERL